MDASLAPPGSNIPTIKQKFERERSFAKVINFAIVYGKGESGIADELGCTVQEARDTFDRWFESKPEVRRWIDETKRRVRRVGTTHSIIGRVRFLFCCFVSPPAVVRCLS